LGTVLALVISLFSGLPIPLQAVQILFINFLMDGLIAISLGVEPAEKGLMYKKPRKVKDGILDKSTLYLLGFAGLVIGMLTIGVFSFYINLGYDVKKAETIFFITLIFARIFNGLACRSLEVGIFRMNFFSNLPLLLSILVSIVLTILVVNVEILREAFHNDLISLNDWVVSFILGFFVLVLVEIYKLIIRVNPKKFNSGEAR
jgi:Ca2+-transporting ATPase